MRRSQRHREEELSRFDRIPLSRQMVITASPKQGVTVCPSFRGEGFAARITFKFLTSVIAYQKYVEYCNSKIQAMHPVMQRKARRCGVSRASNSIPAPRRCAPGCPPCRRPAALQKRWIHNDQSVGYAIHRVARRGSIDGGAVAAHNHVYITLPRKARQVVSRCAHVLIVEVTAASA